MGAHTARPTPLISVLSAGHWLIKPVAPAIDIGVNLSEPNNWLKRDAFSDVRIEPVAEQRLR